MIAAVLLALVQGGTLVVQPAGPLTRLTDALEIARPGDRIIVKSGIYREPAIVVRVPVEIIGEGEPVFVGGAHSTLDIRADRVTVRGLSFRDVTPSMNEDRAAILVTGARECRIEQNRIRGDAFGIYLKKANGCRLTGNRVDGPPGASATASQGNGIHVWQSRDVVLDGNQVVGNRDGIYLEFVTGAEVRDNLISGSARYGMHFMRSDSCTYERNRFVANGAGVAVMYSRWARMLDNRFERNWGSAAYGLLLKEISDSDVRGNTFLRNTVALYLDDSNRNRIEGNAFAGNGWAVRLLASATDNRFTRNRFLGNSFDVATNSRSTTSEFRENWWDRYHGYDLDRDGYGDVPFRPVRLFALIVEQTNPALLLLRSAFVDLLDNAERLLPILTPEALVDARPLMEPPR